MSAIPRQPHSAPSPREAGRGLGRGGGEGVTAQPDGRNQGDHFGHGHGHHRSLAACVLLACFAAGCAGILGGGRRLAPSTETGQAWQALVDGNGDQAAALFKRALGSKREPRTLALFGAGSLAYERGDDEAAVAFYLDLIEAAAEGGDGRDGLLASAAAARLPRLLDELSDRRAAEERVLALPRQRLPWRAQYLLASLCTEIARRRAAAGLLEKEARRSGCLPELRLVGIAGRLPYLDLLSGQVRPAKPERALARSGCRFTTPSTDPLPGVRVLHSEVEVRAGHYQIVLDYAGPARCAWTAAPGFTTTIRPRPLARAGQRCR